jgi:transcriptional regulator with XRE-family HTH domain
MQAKIKPAKKLRKYRRNVLFDTIEGVAKRADLSPSLVSQVEAGIKKPGPKAVPMLAHGYQLSIDEFQKLYGLI